MTPVDKMPKGFQFVWTSEFFIGFWIPRSDSSWKYIYDWTICLGFFELRKWSIRSLEQFEKDQHE